ncbi:MAG: TonB-dependent receptor [Bacteroidales bacterium]|jgi:iron complex outermembrane receptor protein|nr:TonB-dependent receptor [Bacteroidales bacterium]
MRFLFLFLIIAVPPAVIFAQNESIPVVNIPEVMIYENRIQLPLSQKPSSIVVIDLEQINHLPVQSIADLIHYIAGIDMRQRGSNGVQSDVSIRGSSFDQVLILINGIKINDPQTGHFSLNLPVDISNVDHIVVYKGPSARVFGQNAFAGAINIITKNPDDKYIQLQLIAGDFGLAGGNFSASLSGNNIKNYLSVHDGKSSGYKYNTDYRITNIFYQSEIKTGSGMINLLSGYCNRKFGANGFYSSPDNKDQYESVQTSLVAISFKPCLKNPTMKLNNRLYWRRNRDEYLFIRNDPSFYRNLHINNIVGIDLNLSFESSLGVTGMGLDLNIPWITSNRLGNRNRKAATIFIEHRIPLLKGNMNIIPGIQVNVFSDFENNLLPGIDIGYSLNPSLIAFISSGYTYRVPTYTDLYYEDPVNSSNPDLQPEYAFSYEAGLKTVRINGFTGQLSYFFRNNFNLIDRSKENVNDRWKPENIGEVKMNGMDINLNIQPGKLIGIKDIIIHSFDLSYTFIHSRVGGDLPLFSKFTLENLRNQAAMSFELRYYRNIYQSVNFRYIDRVNMKDYTVVDSRMGWYSQKFSIYIDLSNIFNVEYREANYVTLPGRWVKAGATYKFSLKGKP